MQTKLFVGTRFTPELKMEMGTDLSPLSSIPHEGKEYLGWYLEVENPTVEEIRAQCDAFLLTLQKLLPQSRVDHLPVVVFPQLFVG